MGNLDPITLTAAAPKSENRHQFCIYPKVYRGQIYLTFHSFASERMGFLEWRAHNEAVLFDIRPTDIVSDIPGRIKSRRTYTEAVSNGYQEVRTRRIYW